MTAITSTHTHPQFLTVREASVSTRYSPKTVRTWIRDGLLPAYRVEGGTIRIVATDLEDFVRRYPAQD